MPTTEPTIMDGMIDDASLIVDMISDKENASHKALRKCLNKTPNNKYWALIRILPALTIEQLDSPPPISSLNSALGNAWRELFSHELETHPKWAQARLAYAILANKDRILSELKSASEPPIFAVPTQQPVKPAHKTWNDVKEARKSAIAAEEKTTKSTVKHDSVVSFQCTAAQAFKKPSSK